MALFVDKFVEALSNSNKVNNAYCPPDQLLTDVSEVDPGKLHLIYPSQRRYSPKFLWPMAMCLDSQSKLPTDRPRAFFLDEDDKEKGLAVFNFMESIGDETPKPFCMTLDHIINYDAKFNNVNNWIVFAYPHDSRVELNKLTQDNYHMSLRYYRLLVENYNIVMVNVSGVRAYDNTLIGTGHVMKLDLINYVPWIVSNKPCQAVFSVTMHTSGIVSYTGRQTSVVPMACYTARGSTSKTMGTTAKHSFYVHDANTDESMIFVSGIMDEYNITNVSRLIGMQIEMDCTGEYQQLYISTNYTLTKKEHPNSKCTIRMDRNTAIRLKSIYTKDNPLLIWKGYSLSSSSSSSSTLLTTPPPATRKRTNTATTGESPPTKKPKDENVLTGTIVACDGFQIGMIVGRMYDDDTVDVSVFAVIDASSESIVPLDIPVTINVNVYTLQMVSGTITNGIISIPLEKDDASTTNTGSLTEASQVQVEAETTSTESLIDVAVIDEFQSSNNASSPIVSQPDTTNTSLFSDENESFYTTNSLIESDSLPPWPNDNFGIPSMFLNENENDEY